MTGSHNLPLQLTSFIGRQREDAEVKQLLATARLLTLTGSGGVGKTRLALQVVADLVADFADGVRFVDLAPLSDGSLVAQAVASAIGVPEQPGRPLADTLSDALRSKHSLLLLDNCEHLLPAIVQLVDRLLRACPLLHILATSREALNIAGETAWRVPSLTVPTSGAVTSLNQLRTTEAVQLFEERARAVLPSFALSERNAASVAEVCRRLDGVPLAVELAAARVKLLAVEQIAARIDDRFRLLTTASRLAPTRQQTLQATVQWSYGLLSEQEQRLFDRLSVFAGGWTLEAAEAVAGGDGIEPGEVLDLLGRLVDKSLVLAEPSEDGIVRYRLLETLRQYGQERLREGGESEAVARRHASFFIEFAEEAAAGFFGPHEPQAVRRLEAEHDNVRVALKLLIGRGDAEHGQRLGAAIGMFWWFRSYLTEGRAWLHQLLAPPTGGAAPARAMCLYVAGVLAMGQGDYGAAQTRAEESLALWRQLGNEREAAMPCMLLGLLTEIRGDEAAAGTMLEDAAAMGQRAGNHAYGALSLFWLAGLVASQGHFATARSRAEQARARATEIGWARLIALALSVLADICFEQGDDSSARLFAEESVARTRDQMAAPWFLALPLTGLGQVATAQRDFARAQAALVEGAELSRQIGDKSGVAAGLEAFAYLASALRQPERAACLVAAAEAVRQSIGGTVRRASRRVGSQLEGIAASLKPEAYQAARLKGRSMSLEDAVAYALSGEETADHAGGSTRPLDALTPREREVAALVAEGLTNRQIADRLVVTEKTVANHVARVFDKLGLHSRIQLAMRAVELGLYKPV